MKCYAVLRGSETHVYGDGETLPVWEWTLVKVFKTKKKAEKYTKLIRNKYKIKEMDLED